MRPTSPRPAPAYLTDSVPARRGHPLGFAHRGAAVDRENSLAAFVDAHAAGFTYLELDVRTTADGELVVFHDETLDRVSTGRGRLRDHTWERLADVTVGGEPLLRFTELLTALPEARLNVDLKDRAAIAKGLNALLATVTTSGSAPVVVAQRLRKGSCGSPRGAKRLVADALKTVSTPV